MDNVQTAAQRMCEIIGFTRLQWKQDIETMKYLQEIYCDSAEIWLFLLKPYYRFKESGENLNQPMYV